MTIEVYYREVASISFHLSFYYVIWIVCMVQQSIRFISDIKYTRYISKKQTLLQVLMGRSYTKGMELNQLRTVVHSIPFIYRNLELFSQIIPVQPCCYFTFYLRCETVSYIRITRRSGGEKLVVMSGIWGAVKQILIK